MAGQTAVADIGVRLTLDSTQFNNKMRAATQEVARLQSKATAVGRTQSAANTGAVTAAGGGGRRGGGAAVTTLEAQFSPTQISAAAKQAVKGMGAVPIPVIVQKGSLAKMRRDIIAGIGSVPVTIVPKFAGSGPQSITNTMGAVLAMQYGISQTQGRALFKETVQKIGPMPSGKAMGGSVRAGQAMVVGERRPEVFVPDTNGRILPTVDGYRKQISQLATLEAEIYTRQRRLEAALTSIPHAQNGRVVYPRKTVQAYGYDLDPRLLREIMHSQEQLTQYAASNPVSAFGGNIWYPGRRRKLIEDALAAGSLDQSRGIATMAHSAKRAIEMGGLASPGISDAMATKWVNELLRTPRPSNMTPEDFVRRLTAMRTGLGAGQSGYGGILKALEVAEGKPARWGNSPKVHPFTQAILGLERAFVMDSHHLQSTGIDPDFRLPGSKMSFLERASKTLVRGRPTNERAYLLEAANRIQPAYADVFDSIRRWQAGIWTEHFPRGAQFGGTNQPIEAALTNLVVPKGYRSQVPPGFKLGPGGLLLPRMAGGPVHARLGLTGVEQGQLHDMRRYFGQQADRPSWMKPGDPRYYPDWTDARKAENVVKQLERLSPDARFPTVPHYTSGDPSGHIIRTLYGFYQHNPRGSVAGSTIDLGSLERRLAAMEPSDLGIFHATTNLPSVLAGGLKSGEEVGSAALGGHNRYVSTTFSRKRAETLASDLEYAGRVARAEVSLEDILERYRPRFSDKQWNKPFGIGSGMTTEKLTGDVANQARTAMKHVTALRQRGLMDVDNAQYWWFGEPSMTMGTGQSMITGDRLGKGFKWEPPDPRYKPGGGADFDPLFSLFTDIDRSADGAADPRGEGAFFFGAAPRHFKHVTPDKVGVVQAAARQQPIESLLTSRGGLYDTEWSDSGIRPAEWEMRFPSHMLNIIGRMAGGPVRPGWKTLEKRGLRHFGETDSLAAAGYTSPGGRMLDFAGSSKYRYFPHADAYKLFTGANPDQALSSVGWMLDAGFFRNFDFEDDPYGLLSGQFSKPLTDAQIDTMFRGGARKAVFDVGGGYGPGGVRGVHGAVTVGSWPGEGVMMDLEEAIERAQKVARMRMGRMGGGPVHAFAGALAKVPKITGDMTRETPMPRGIRLFRAGESDQVGYVGGMKEWLGLPGHKTEHAFVSRGTDELDDVLYYMTSGRKDMVKSGQVPRYYYSEDQTFWHNHPYANDAARNLRGYDMPPAHSASDIASLIHQPYGQSIVMTAGGRMSGLRKPRLMPESAFDASLGEIAKTQAVVSHGLSGLPPEAIIDLMYRPDPDYGGVNKSLIFMPSIGHLERRFGISPEEWFKAFEQKVGEAFGLEAFAKGGKVDRAIGPPRLARDFALAPIPRGMSWGAGFRADDPSIRGLKDLQSPWMQDVSATLPMNRIYSAWTGTPEHWASAMSDRIRQQRLLSAYEQDMIFGYRKPEAGERLRNIHGSGWEDILTLPGIKKLPKQQAGGRGAFDGLYIVGEIGEEMFVPNRLAHLIPQKVMQQIPKRSDGGGVEMIGRRRNELYSPPEDGIIIPNRLLPQVKHLVPGAFGGAFTGEWSEAWRRALAYPRRIDTPRGPRWQGPLGFVPEPPPVSEAFAGTPESPFPLTQPGDLKTPSYMRYRQSGAQDPNAMRAAMVGALEGPGQSGETQTVSIDANSVDLTGNNIAINYGSGGGYSGPAGPIGPRGPGGGGPQWATPPGRLPGTGLQQDEDRSGMFWSHPSQPGLRSAKGGPFSNLMERGGFKPDNARLTQADLDIAGQQTQRFYQQEARSAEIGEAAGEFNEMMRDMVAGGTRWQEWFSARTPRGGIAYQISQTLGGGARMKALQRQLGIQARALDRTVSETDRPEETMAALKQYLETPEEIEAARMTGDTQRVKDLEEARANIIRQYGEETKQVDEMQATLKKLDPTFGGVVKQMGSVILGVAAYGVIMSALNRTMQAGAPAVTTWVDSMRGWQATSDAVTNSMAAQTRQSYGNVQAMMSQHAAQAGLSAGMAEFIESTLEATVATKAGAQAQKLAEESIKAATYVGQQESIPGLRSGFGGVGGGGLFAEAMGGGPGTFESIIGSFGAVRAQEGDWITGGARQIEDLFGNADLALNWLGSQTTRDAIRRQQEALGLPSVESMFMQGVENAAFAPMNLGPAVADWIATQAGAPDLVSGSLVQDIFTKDIPNFIGGLFGQPVSAATPEGAETTAGAAETAAAEPFDPMASIQEEDRPLARQNLVDLNKAIQRGADELGADIAGSFDFAKSQEELDNAIREAWIDNDPQRAALAEAGVVIRDATGSLVTSFEEVDKILEQVAKGRTIVDPEVWARDNLRALTAQFDQIDIQSDRQMRLTGFSTTQRLLQNPLIRPGAGMFRANTPEAIRAAGGGGAVGQIGGFLSDAQASQDRLADIAKDGWDQMEADVLEFAPGMITEFRTLKGEAIGLSESIASTTTQMMEAQQAASEANWANQIRIAQRSLGDALGMLGQAGGTRLGYLQREQWLAQRASQSLGLAAQRISLVSQELSLALQKRQIATQLALAQFQAPGETGEERYARQREAIIRAGIQRRQVGLGEQQLGISQEQLGLSQKQFAIAGKIWSEQARRNAEDARRALEVMRRARRAEAITVAAQAALAGYQQELADKMQRIGVITGKANQRFSTALGIAAQKAAQFAGDVALASKVILRAVGAESTTGGRGGALKVDPKTGKIITAAPGFYGITTGRTEMTVGEAGTETVAVLRNPRRAMLQGGGGGGGPINVNINMNGVSVREEGDADRLARRVAREVERILSSKGEMLGLRQPSY